MAKAPKKKKAASKKASDVSDFEDVSDDDESARTVEPFAHPVVIIPDAAPASNIVAVGQRFWLLAKGHRRKARPVQVAGVVGEGDSVTIRCLDNGEQRVLPRVAFATAGSSRVLRA